MPLVVYRNKSYRMVIPIQINIAYCPVFLLNTALTIALNTSIVHEVYPDAKMILVPPNNCAVVQIYSYFNTDLNMPLSLESWIRGRYTVQSC